MNDKKKVFEEYPALKALTIMAVPAIVSQLITLIYNIADTWFIGLTDDPNMVAACSLVLPIYMLSVAISNLFGTLSRDCWETRTNRKQKKYFHSVYGCRFFLQLFLRVEHSCFLTRC